MEKRTQPLARDAMAYVWPAAGGPPEGADDRRAKPAVYLAARPASSISRCRTR